MTLPEELRSLYRVTRGRWQDWGGDQEVTERVVQAVGCELFALDDVYIADPASRTSPWRYAAMEAVVTRPDATVQGVVGSAGWIVFADTGGGDRIAVDLTPGPRGHLGQIIVLSHEESVGADLVADSLTDLVSRRRSDRRGSSRREELPTVARVNRAALDSVEAAVHPELEVLSIGVWEGNPISLAPVTGLPRLRTLTAYPGTLADPLEIAELTGLEFLDLGPEDWRVLLDAGAVPRSLSAASIEVHGERHPPDRGPRQRDPRPVGPAADHRLRHQGRPRPVGLAWRWRWRWRCRWWRFAGSAGDGQDGPGEGGRYDSCRHGRSAPRARCGSALRACRCFALSARRRSLPCPIGEHEQPQHQEASRAREGGGAQVDGLLGEQAGGRLERVQPEHRGAGDPVGRRGRTGGLEVAGATRRVARCRR